MTDDERRVLEEAHTECVVAIAYLQGPNDRADALAMMAKVLDRITVTLGLRHDPVAPSSLAESKGGGINSATPSPMGKSSVGNSNSGIINSPSEPPQPAQRPAPAPARPPARPARPPGAPTLL